MENGWAVFQSQTMISQSSGDAIKEGVKHRGNVWMDRDIFYFKIVDNWEHLAAKRVFTCRDANRGDLEFARHERRHDVARCQSSFPANSPRSNIFRAARRKHATSESHLVSHAVYPRKIHVAPRHLNAASARETDRRIYYLMLND